MEILLNSDIIVTDLRGVEFDAYVERAFDGGRFYMVRLKAFNVALVIDGEQFSSPSRAALDEAQTDWLREQTFFQ